MPCWLAPAFLTILEIFLIFHVCFYNIFKIKSNIILDEIRKKNNMLACLCLLANRSGTTRTVGLDIFKAFDTVWHAGLLHKLRSYGISDEIFGVISFFLSNRQLQVALDGKFSQEYPVNAGIPQDSILGPTLFLLYINDLPDDPICNIAIYADDTTLYPKCG